MAMSRASTKSRSEVRIRGIAIITVSVRVSFV
jgi:hypothetical protein